MAVALAPSIELAAIARGLVTRDRPLAQAFAQALRQWSDANDDPRVPAMLSLAIGIDRELRRTRTSNRSGNPLPPAA